MKPVRLKDSLQKWKWRHRHSLTLHKTQTFLILVNSFFLLDVTNPSLKGTGRICTEIPKENEVNVSIFKFLTAYKFLSDHTGFLSNQNLSLARQMTYLETKIIRRLVTGLNVNSVYKCEYKFTNTILVVTL